MKFFNFKAAYDQHNFYHYLGSFAMVFAFVFLFGLSPQKASIYSFLAGLLWEIGDAIKPNWRKGLDKPYWIQMLFYSDGFSLWDLLVPDTGGIIAAYFFLSLLK